MILYLFIAKEGTSRKVPSTQRMSNKISRPHTDKYTCIIPSIIVSILDHRYQAYKSHD